MLREVVRAMECLCAAFIHALVMFLILMAKLMSPTMLGSCEDLFHVVDKPEFSKESWRIKFIFTYFIATGKLARMNSLALLCFTHALGSCWRGGRGRRCKVWSTTVVHRRIMLHLKHWGWHVIRRIDLRWHRCCEWQVEFRHAARNRHHSEQRRALFRLSDCKSRVDILKCRILWVLCSKSVLFCRVIVISGTA